MKVKTLEKPPEPEGDVNVGAASEASRTDSVILARKRTQKRPLIFPGLLCNGKPGAGPVLSVCSQENVPALSASPVRREEEVLAASQRYALLSGLSS